MRCSAYSEWSNKLLFNTSWAINGQELSCPGFDTKPPWDEGWQRIRIQLGKAIIPLLKQRWATIWGFLTIYCPHVFVELTHKWRWCIHHVTRRWVAWPIKHSLRVQFLCIYIFVFSSFFFYPLGHFWGLARIHSETMKWRADVECPRALKHIHPDIFHPSFHVTSCCVWPASNDKVG